MDQAVTASKLDPRERRISRGLMRDAADWDIVSNVYRPLEHTPSDPRRAARFGSSCLFRALRPPFAVRGGAA